MVAKTVMVTGTRRGITQRQEDVLSNALWVLRMKDFSVFLDGDCVGADVQARQIAQHHEYRCVVHPSTAVTRAYYQKYDFIRDPAPPLVRNRTMVDESNLVLGLPSGMSEELRSGTWACLRYTGKVHRPTIILWPDGSLTNYREGYRR